MFDRSERGLRLTLHTEAFVVRGSVQTGHRRLSDVLNQAEHEFVVLHDVELTEVGGRADPIRTAFAQVNFEAILFAVADERIAPSPELRQPKIQETALISIPPFTVVGRIHLLPEPDLRLGLNELTGRFVAVTDAAFWSDRLGVARVSAPMLAVNHARAQILAPWLEGAPGAGSGETAAESGETVAGAGTGWGG